MVLEAAYDGSPTSDYDPYEGNNDAASRNASPNIDISKRARPFALLGPLLGFTTTKLVKDVQDIAARAPLIIRRQLTQDELDAVVTAVSRRDQTASWIEANALIYACFRWYRTQAEGTYPLWSLNGKRKLTPALFSLPSTPFTRLGVQQARLSIWVVAFMIPAYAIGSILGQSAMAAQQLTDPRMKGFLNDMRSEAAQRNLKSGMTREVPSIPQLSQGAQAQNRNSITPATSPFQQTTDDYSSPTEQPAQADQKNDRQNIPRSSWGSTSSAPASEVASDSDYLEPDRGVGYATGPEAQSSWDKIRSQTGATETAWDRVRRGTDQQVSSPTSWQPRSNRSENDYTFNEHEEDRQLAKPEAQKDFDARIERERHGRNFDDTRGSKGFW